MGSRRSAVLALVMLVSCVGCGTTYMKDRGNDLMDIIELGITTSPAKQPGFAANVNFFNIVPVGYAHVCGWYTGLGARQFGVMDFQDASWGALLGGSDNVRIGKFDPNDPHEAWVNRMAARKAAGKRLPTKRPRYNVGVARMISEDNTPPPPTFLPCGRKHLHLGWIGILVGAHPVELVDFVLGWTTLDFMGDDVAAKPDIRD